MSPRWHWAVECDSPRQLGEDVTEGTGGWAPRTALPQCLPRGPGKLGDSRSAGRADGGDVGTLEKL